MVLLFSHTSHGSPGSPAFKFQLDFFVFLPPLFLAQIWSLKSARARRVPTDHCARSLRLLGHPELIGLERDGFGPPPPTGKSASLLQEIHRRAAHHWGGSRAVPFEGHRTPLCPAGSGTVGPHLGGRGMVKGGRARNLSGIAQSFFLWTEFFPVGHL